MLQIERLNENNLSDAAELERVNFSDGWSKDALKEEIDNPDALYLLVRETETDNIIAMAGLIISFDTADVMNVSVLREFRRNNTAFHLLQNLIDEGKRRGVNNFTLEVREHNIPARRLYEKLGFKYEGTRPNFYKNPEEGAAIYWLRTEEVTNV